MARHRRKTKIFFSKTVWISSLLFFFTSFSVLADEPKPSGFLDYGNMTIRGDLPFELGWNKPGVNWKQYQKVVIAPVDTQYLMESDYWQEFGRSGEIQSDIKKIALYTRSAFERAFITDPKKRFKVTYSMQPDPSILRVEMALTELTPNKIFLKTLGYVPLVGWGAKAANLTNMSHVSIEIRLKDAETGEILAKFADRQKEPFTIVNIEQFSMYGFAEKRIDQWAAKLVETLNRKPGTVVEKSSSFHLKPW